MAWMLLLLCFDRGDLATRETKHVDMIELSHIGDAKGNIVFHQLILWRIDAATGHFHSVGWRLCHPATGVIERRGETWLVRGVGDTERMVFVSKTFKESWSAIDPESEDKRSFWRGDAPNLFHRQRVPVVVEVVEND
jgi:hypothetical protein